MLFSRDKDDDDDFIPNPNYRSNLSNIFGGAGSGGENSSLTYTPPKQPRRQNKPTTIAAPVTSATRTPSLLCAKTVQTFKMVDGAYQNQGKVGVAVLSFGSEEGSTFQILLYRDKQNHLCYIRIVREFNFHIQPKNYCTFYDNKNVIWSILFDSPADMAEFNLQVAKCRWKAEQSTSPILTQDLWCPVASGDAAKTAAAAGDSVELTYTLKTIDSSSEEVGESQRVVVEVEAAGWKQALVGVQLNTQRVIILQPFMLGDLNPSEVVYNSPVIVKFTVLQVSKASKPEPPALPVLPALPAEDNKISLVNEIPKHEPALPDITDQKTAESSQSPKSTKADLINRMARMGQALPFKQAVPTPSDSDETEEDHKSPMHRLSKVVPKPRARAQHGGLPPVAGEGAVMGGGAGETPSITPPVAVTSQVPVQWATGMQPYMVGNMYPVPQVSSPMEAHSPFNMFLSEVRTTNSELRMGLTRLTDKVDILQTKVEDSKKPPSQDISNVLEKLMEGEQQLKDQLQQVLITLQNTQLASSQSRASVEASAQLPVAPDLPRVSVAPCQQCAELHQAHISLSEQMKKLQEENEFLQTSLTAQKDALFNAKIADKGQLSQIASLQMQLAEEQKSVSDLNNSLESLQRVKEILADDLQTANNSIAELQDTLREKQTSIDRLEQALKDSEATKLDEVRRNLQEVLDPKPVIGEHIKKILNAVYRLVKVQFEPQNRYDSSFIQSVLAETIKAVTLEYLQNGELMSLATPAVSVQSMPTPETSGQGKPEDSRTLYVDQEQRSGSDVDCKSSVVTTSEISISSEQSSDGSLINQSISTTANKVPDKNHTEEKQKQNGLNDKDPPVDNNTSVNVKTGVENSADESSDDVQFQLSEKLQTVLLHMTRSKTKMFDPTKTLPGPSPLNST